MGKLWCKFRTAVRDWWGGKLVDLNKPGDRLVFIGPYYERHWTARALDAAWKYFLTHHQWIIGTVLLGLLGLYVAAKFK